MTFKDRVRVLLKMVDSMYELDYNDIKFKVWRNEINDLLKEFFKDSFVYEYFYGTNFDVISYSSKKAKDDEFSKGIDRTEIALSLALKEIDYLNKFRDEYLNCSNFSDASEKYRRHIMDQFELNLGRIKELGELQSKEDCFDNFCEFYCCKTKLMFLLEMFDVRLWNKIKFNELHYKISNSNELIKHFELLDVYNVNESNYLEQNTDESEMLQYTDSFSFRTFSDDREEYIACIKYLEEVKVKLFKLNKEISKPSRGVIEEIAVGVQEMDSIKASEKIFISHASADFEYIKVFVDLLKCIGFKQDNLICSSIDEFMIPNGQNIYDYLKKELKGTIKVLYILSSNYYRSAACLNEMGATWALDNQNYEGLLIPDFDYTKIKGVIDLNKIMYKLNDYSRILTLKSELEEILHSKVSDIKWNNGFREYEKKIDNLVEQDRIKNRNFKILVENVRLDRSSPSKQAEIRLRIVNNGDIPVQLDELDITLRDEKDNELSIDFESEDKKHIYKTYYNGENVVYTFKYDIESKKINPNKVDVQKCEVQEAYSNLYNK